MLTALALLMIQQNSDAPKLEIVLPAAIKVGKPLIVSLKATLPEGWHAYQNPPSDEYQNPLEVMIVGKGLPAFKVSYPKGEDYLDQNTSKKIKVYMGTVTMQATNKARLKAGTFNANVTLRYQLCNETTCLPPKSISKTAKIVVSK